MRQRFQERTQRFLNAKQRTIGIDKEFLDQQVNEKNMVYEEERNKSILEGKSNAPPKNCLEENPANRPFSEELLAFLATNLSSLLS